MSVIHLWNEDVKDINRTIKLLCPWVMERLDWGYSRCHDFKLECMLYEGFRSPERQDYLYSLGRTNKERDDVVTNARAWESWHNYGLAVDVVFIDDHGHPSWEGDHEALQKAFMAAGFERGPDWDKCHFQLTGGFTIDGAQKYVKEKGLLAFWNAVQRNL